MLLDDPDCPGAAERAVPPGRGNLQFFRVPDPVNSSFVHAVIAAPPLW
jgi:hypothetical protein